MVSKQVTIIFSFVFLQYASARLIDPLNLLLFGQNDVERQCTPGESYQEDCNICICAKDGINFSCTTRKCSLQEDIIRCNPGKIMKLGCKFCICEEDGAYTCTSNNCHEDFEEESDNEVNKDFTLDNFLHRKKRQTDYPIDYYDDPVPLSAEQRSELDRQRYIQLRQEAIDKQREEEEMEEMAAELAQQQEELRQQQEEMQRELQYQRELDYQQWQLDQNQQALDSRQYEIDRRDYFNQPKQSSKKRY